jgi:hypothetical protein
MHRDVEGAIFNQLYRFGGKKCVRKVSACRGVATWHSGRQPVGSSYETRTGGVSVKGERNPGIKDVSFEVDGMTVAKANTKVEDTPIKRSLLTTPISKRQEDTRRTFSCLIEEREQSLADVFTDKWRLIQVHALLSSLTDRIRTSVKPNWIRSGEIG